MFSNLPIDFNVVSIVALVVWMQEVTILCFSVQELTILCFSMQKLWGILDLQLRNVGNMESVVKMCF